MVFNKFKYLCVIVAIFSVLFESASAYQTSKDYLKARLKETKELLAQNYKRYVQASASEENSYVVDWVKLWSKTTKAARPRTINFLNQSFLVDRDEKTRVLFSRSTDASSTDNYIDLIDQLNLVSTLDPVKFLKYFSWNGLPFLLICRSKLCTIFHGLELQNYQKIEFSDLLPENSCFFTRGKNLYLVISYVIEKNPFSHATPSKIFIWSDMKMIQVDELLTPPVRTLTTFQEAESTILILAFKSELNDKVYCVVYKIENDMKAKFVMYLTNTGPVMFIHSYTHDDEEFAILISNNQQSSGIFWWEETELRKWISLPDIKPSSLINMLQAENETLLFVGNSNLLSIYKIEKRKCIKLDELKLKTRHQITEISTWEKENSIMLLLITVDPEGVYQTQMWQLDLSHVKTESEELNDVAVCFEKLQSTIDFRTAALNNLKNNQWKYTSLKGPIQLSGLQKSSSSFIMIDSQGKNNVSSPVDLKNELFKLEKNVGDIHSSMKESIKENRVINFSGNTVVNGKAHFHELHIDNLNVDFLNNQKAEIDSIVVSKTDQKFSMPLQVDTVLIDDLEVANLCGLESDNWILVNDTDKIALSQINFTRIYNDTIVAKDNVNLKNLNHLSIINGIKIKSFFDDIFMLGKNQNITGNLTYLSLLRVMKLTADRVNNVSSTALIKKHTNQSLDEVYIDKLEASHLYVDKINGVPVDKAARMSRKNNIQGKVTIGTLVITDELEVEKDVALSLAYPTQVYDGITILGDVFVQNLEFENQVPLMFHDDINKTYDIQEILKNSWSKSRNQTIENSIVLEKGASIDELNCDYLNGLSEADFVYVDTKELRDLENVSFSHFHFNKVIEENSVLSQGIVQETPDLVTFLEPIRIDRLSVDNIIMSYYNGIPIESIVNGNENLKLSGTTEFDTVHVDKLVVDELQMNRLNSIQVPVLEHALNSNQPIKLKSLKVNSANMRNMVVKKLNGEDLAEALLAQDNLDNGAGEISLTVGDEIRVENNLQIDGVNDMTIDEYLDTLRQNLVNSMETKNLKSLHVLKNLTVSFINNHPVDDYFDQALSKTKKQTISGDVTLINTNVNKLKTEIINDKDVSKLVFIDDPLIFYENVTFNQLFITGNIKTRTLNGEDILKLKRDLVAIPLKNLQSLHVIGNTTWNEESSEPITLTYLLNNAITKHENQTIESPINFGKQVTINSLYLENGTTSEVFQKIRDILSDAVLEDPDSEFITIKGTKIFKENLTIDDLEVTNNLEIKSINGMSIDEAISRIFLKYKNNSISSQIIFLEPVKIRRLYTNASIHQVSIENIALLGKRMPTYIYFKNMVVESDVSLYKLDGIDFEDFKKKRITLDGDHEIVGDVIFDGPIIVTNESYVSYVNAIKPENLVINTNTTNLPVIVHGRKTFLSNLVIQGDAELDTINDYNVKEIVKDVAGNSITVRGNLIFEQSVETQGNVTVHGQINGIKPDGMLSALKQNELLVKNTIDNAETLVKNTLIKSLKSLTGVKNHLFYLEEDEELKLNLPGVQNVRSARVGSTTRLDIYASTAPSFCGLPENCSCRKQYVVEIPETGDLSIRQENLITFNFFALDGSFKLEVVNNVFSYSESCSKISEKARNAHIFWIKNDALEIKEPVVQVPGFIADAEVFKLNDRSDNVYLILAIYYNETSKSHATDSLVYKFNLQNDEIRFVQSIKTDGVRLIRVFQNNNDVYALMACIKGKAETILLRFESGEQKFEQIRTFATRGSMLITSLNIDNKSFIILNNPDIDALQIFTYNSTFDNFYDYQNLYFESKVTGLNVVYTGEYEKSEGFIIVSTMDGNLHIYEYMYFGKFQLKMSHWAENIETLSPFRHLNQNYLLASLRLNSTVYKFIQQGLD